MFNDCPACGHYAVEKVIDPAGPVAICPACGHRLPFRQLPLFVITGAGGTGKSTLAGPLAAALPEAVVLDTDTLGWPRQEARHGVYPALRDHWLRLAKNIGQAGRPVVLCGASAMPYQLDPLPERRYLGRIHHLILVCDEADLAARLRRRAPDRPSSQPAFVAAQLALNAWLRAQAPLLHPPVRLLDTSRTAPAACVAQAAHWVRLRAQPARFRLCLVDSGPLPPVSTPPAAGRILGRTGQQSTIERI